MRGQEIPVGTKLEGTFSKLPFAGEVVGYIAECVRVKLSSAYDRRMPAPGGRLTFHPNDSNVVWKIVE